MKHNVKFTSLDVAVLVLALAAASFFVLNVSAAPLPISTHATLSTSLVSYWGMEEATDATRVDSHGFNDLDVGNSVAQGSGHISNGADLELTDSDYLSITDASQSGLDIIGDISVSLWFKPESAPSGGSKALFYKWNNSDSNGSYGLIYTDTGGTKSFTLNIYDAAAPTTNVPYKWDSVDLGTGTFKHIVVTWDETGHASGDGTAELWVDGSSQGTVTDGSAADINNSGGNFSIGALDTGIQWFTDGVIDEVGIWSKVLSSSEISDLYNSGNGLPYSDSAPIGELGVRKGTTQTLSNDTTTDDDSDLIIGLAANTEYVIDGVIFASSTSSKPDMKVAFTAPSGAVIDVAVTTSSSRQIKFIQTSDVDTNVIPIKKNKPIAIQVVGTVKTSSIGGNLSFQWAQNSSSAASTGVLRGSYLRVDEI